MANLNLSEFTEKLFVADADHTFIWDTANAISKRVSRNSWLNSGELTSSAPVTISQTWNGTSSTVFTALKVNATTPGTTSSTSSLLLDLQVGGTSIFKVDRSGSVTLSYASGLFISPSNRVRLGNNSTDAAEGLFIGNTSYIGFINGANSNLGSDSKLYGESLNTLALRNGTAAQTFNVYGTSSASNANYARLALTCGLDGNATISTQALGTGTAGVLAFSPGNSERMRITTAGNVGIGTTSPGAKLDIATSAAFDGIKITNSNTTSAAKVTLVNNTGIESSFACYSSSMTDGYANNGAFGASNSVIINADGGVFSGGSNSIQFRAGGYGAAQERMRITAAGNVGIGTTAPRTKLHLEDTASPFVMEMSGSTIPNFTGVGFSPTLGNNTNLRVQSINAAWGGTSMAAFGANQNSVPVFNFEAHHGSTSPTTPAFSFFSYKHNGSTGRTAFGANEISYQFSNASSQLLTVLGSGNVGIGTTSPTSKLHVVGDAVLTGQLLGSNYTVGTADSVTQANIAITNNHVGFADSAIVITPKGVGAFIVGPKPDGTATGGNARGNYAVDLQISKTANTQIAAGINSVITGGKLNTASGELSFVGGGNTNQAGSYLAAVGAGSGNNSNGYASYVGCGTSNTANGSWAFVGGGTNNVASADMAFVSGGRNASANRYALNAHSAGQFSQVGDAQKTTAVFRNKTTTNSAVELFLDGALQRYTITSGKIISMLINITGTKSDGSAVAHYVRQYSIKNIGGTTSQVYAAVTVGTDNAAGTSIAISADDTNDSLKIEVTGVAAETWRWVASVDAVEVGHGV